MANDQMDVSISELSAAENILPGDLFVLEQDGTAKKLEGQVLIAWLTAAADGHGGIKSITGPVTDDRRDTYTITLADNTTSTFTVTNGEQGIQGDKGDSSYLHIKWCAGMPSENGSNTGLVLLDTPHEFIGIYADNNPNPSHDFGAYKWYRYKGNPAYLDNDQTGVTYQASESGTVAPTGAWTDYIPSVPQGKYLWTRTVTKWDTGSPIVSYSVARMGINGDGAVSSVSGVGPDAEGNVPLTAADVGALPSSGGSMQGNQISDLGAPENENDAARKRDVAKAEESAIAYANTFTRLNSLDNWNFRNPVNQRGVSGTISAAGYFIDRWMLKSGTVELTDVGLVLNGTMIQILEFPIGQTVTASVLTASGVESADYDDTTCTFSITAAGATIVAAKLELGRTQTLAHQEGEVWELNEIPRFADQLALCQRFAINYSAASACGFITSSKKSLRMILSLPVAMRAEPDMTNLNITDVRTTAGTVSPTISSDTLMRTTSLFNMMVAAETNSFSSSDYTNNTPVVGYVSCFLSADL